MHRRRRYRLHAGVLALLATVFATEQPPRSPLALADAFDHAAAAAAAQIAELEQRCDQPSAPGTSCAAVLDLAERRIAAQDDAATARLDRALAAMSIVTPRRRAATVACIDHHCAIAAASLRHTLRHALDVPDDPLARLEVAEYRATLRRLLAVRALVAG